MLQVPDPVCMWDHPEIIYNKGSTFYNGGLTQSYYEAAPTIVQNTTPCDFHLLQPLQLFSAFFISQNFLTKIIICMNFSDNK